MFSKTFYTGKTKISLMDENACEILYFVPCSLYYNFIFAPYIIGKCQQHVSPYCTQHRAQSTEHTAHCTLHTVHSTQHTSPRLLSALYQTFCQSSDIYPILHCTALHFNVDIYLLHCTAI